MRIAILISLLFIGCSTESVVQEINYYKPIAPIPSLFIAKMDSFIISKTGRNIFEKCISYDSIQSGLLRGNSQYVDGAVADQSRYMANKYYLFVYHFTIPQKPRFKEKLWWPSDTLGNFIDGHLPYGIPDCLSDSGNCSFSVDSLTAISIAKTAGIPLGLKPLTAGISIEKEKVVWVVVSTISEVGEAAEYVFYYVDMSTGKLINKGGLSIRF